MEENKLRRRRNVVEKSQSESKKFHAIDVGLYDSIIMCNCVPWPFAYDTLIFIF